MSAVSLAKAKAHLSELVDRVQVGDTFAITRHGKRLPASSQPAVRDGGSTRPCSPL